MDEFDVVIECTHPEEMFKLLKHHEVDVLLTDVIMPVMNGADLSRAVRQAHPCIKILALSMSGQGDLVNQMIEDADIAGYVLKKIGQKELITALQKISKGGIYFSDEVLKEMTKASDRKKVNEEAHLTAREIQMIKLIENEYSNKDIAEELFLSERTVETDRKNIL